MSHKTHTRIGIRIQGTGKNQPENRKKVDQLTRRQKEIVATVALTLEFSLTRKFIDRTIEHTKEHIKTVRNPLLPQQNNDCNKSVIDRL